MPASVDFYPMGKQTMQLLDSVTISSGASATGYPVENVMDENPDTLWKGSTAANQILDFDFGVAVAATAVYTHLHNYAAIASIEATAVYHSDDDITYTVVAGSSTLLAGSDPHRLTVWTGAGSHRYWQLRTFSITTIPEFGIIGWCNTREMPVGNQFPEDDTRIYHNKSIKTAGGRRFVRGTNGLYQEIFSRTYLINGNTNMNVLLNTAEDCKGSRFPLIVDEGGTLKLCRFLNDKITPNQIEHQLFNPTVRFETMPYIDSGEAF